MIIGDHFVTVDLFREALDRRLTGIQVRYKFVETAWPDDPLKNVEEVHEAGGDVEALVRYPDGTPTAPRSPSQHPRTGTRLCGITCKLTTKTLNLSFGPKRLTKFWRPWPDFVAGLLIQDTRAAL